MLRTAPGKHVCHLFFHSLATQLFNFDLLFLCLYFEQYNIIGTKLN